MIPFNKPLVTGKELSYIKNVIENEQKISGDGIFTKKCTKWLQKYAKNEKALLTTSGTHALEITAFLTDINYDDEIIMPSYTFSSTANAFIIRGGRIVFVDIRPDTMNINENLIENAITNKTKAIVPVHYAGISCSMDKIMCIAKKYNLMVIEDAAQGIMSKYKGRNLGSIGDLGCFSFHETKNISMGEGGAVLIKDSKYFERAEIIREKGTNRSRFFRGEVDKYSWVDWGSSYLPSDINSAYLYAQLEEAGKITLNRLKLWNEYYYRLIDLKNKGVIELPYVPIECQHNGHMFYIKTDSLKTRTKLIDHLKKQQILAVFHYVPLHTSKAGVKYGRFVGEDNYTTKESEKLVRLPMFYDMTINDLQRVVNSIYEFYK